MHDRRTGSGCDAVVRFDEAAQSLAAAHLAVQLGAEGGIEDAIADGPVRSTAEVVGNPTMTAYPHVCRVDNPSGPAQ
jgi:hypothetical protein